MFRVALTAGSLSLLIACGNVPTIFDASIQGDASIASDGSIDAGRDAGKTDSGIRDAGIDAGRDSGFDSGVLDGGLQVSVSHERELRGLWVATVSRLDWPPSGSLSPDAGKDSLAALVNKASSAGINALFFQVRPNSDAVYESALEPWSNAVGGQNPGYDPLATLVEFAHAKGIEVHAWINPYRGTVAALSQHAISYNSVTSMNPGVPAVRAHVVNVVSDILNRYDVDGIHFDDYFYPYPAAGIPYPDDATYSAYANGITDGGTPLGKLDWRRDNVNKLVSDVMNVVKNEHPHVRFGISPFGIYKPGTPPGITGLNSYDALACDSVKWITQGDIDYLAPQLYWTITDTPHSFATLINYWSNLAKENRHIFPGMATHQLGTSAAWSLNEYRNQLNATRAQKAKGAMGEIHFRAAFLFGNQLGVKDLLSEEFYSKPALAPAIPRMISVGTPEVPQVNVNGVNIQMSHVAAETVRYFVVYKKVNQNFEVVRIAGGTTGQFTASSGTYAVSAVGRGGAESLGVQVVVP
jgi:uncharacterized lipoprotein YddW (UPF0748 family)